MSESFLDLKTRGSASAGVDTPNLLADVPRTYADLPASPDDRTVVVLRRGAAYRYADRTAFEMHLRASAGAWAQDGDDMPYYDFGESLTHAGGYVTLRLKFAAAPGGLSGGEVGGKAVAWAAHASTWTAGGPGRYEYRYASADNPLPQNGEITVKFTTANAVKVWYPEVNVAASGDFTPEDAFKLRALTSDSWATLPNALDQQGFFNAVPDISQLNARPYGNTFSWVGSSSSTFYKGFRVAASRRSEIGGFRALVGVNATTALTVLGDDGGFTYGYITLPNYVANTVITMQQPDKVGLDTGRIDLAEWRAALGVAGYGTLADLNAVAAPVAGSAAVVYGDVIANNGVYYRLNTSWTKVGDPRGVRVYTTQALLNRATPVDGVVGVVSEAAHRGVYLRLGGAWLLVGSVTAAQTGNAGASITDMLAALAATAPPGVINVARIPKLGYAQLPDKVVQAAKSIIAGGIVPWPNDNVQLGNQISRNAFANVPNDMQWGNQALRGSDLGGVDVPRPVYMIVRALRSVYVERPTVIPEMKLRPGEEGNYVPTLTALADADNQYWYWNASIPNLPADSNVQMEQDRPTRERALPELGSITLDELAIPPAKKVNGASLVIENDQLDARRLSGTRELRRGTSAIALTSLTGDSALGTSALDASLNLRQSNHGNFHLYVTLTLEAQVPTTLVFVESDALTVDADGARAVFQVAAAPVRQGTSQLGDIIVEAAIKDSADDVVVGNVIYRLPRDAAGDVSLNRRYEGAAGHSKAGSGSVRCTEALYFIDSGVAAATQPNSIGGLFRFDEELPTPGNYDLHDAVVIETGARRSLYTNRDRIVEGTGLGLAGLTWDYQFDGHRVIVGNWTFHYYASGQFTDPTGETATSLPADGTFSNAPDDLLYWVFAYRTDRTEARIYVRFTADQTATNNIQFATGGAGIAIVMRDARNWTAVGIGPAALGHIRQGVWDLTEPDATGTQTVRYWADINAPRWVELLDWQPANGPQLSYLSAYEVPLAQALNPALAEDHDDWAMDLEIQVAAAANAAGRIWSMEETIHCRDWRLAPNSPVNANFSNVAMGWQGGVFLSDNSASGASWTRFVFCKGSNGRPAIIQALNSAVYLRRIRAVRHT